MGPPPAQTQRDPARVFAQILFDPRNKAQLMAALPKHMSAERMTRLALTEFRKNPELSRCDPLSVFAALIQCSQLGLEPGTGLGECYLIPYRNNKSGTYECQMIPGYRGLIKLVLQTGKVTKLVARAVHEGDDFDYAFGLQERLDHVPSQGGRGQLTHVYAVATLEGGEHHFEVMTRAEVEGVAARSRSGNPVWKSDFEEMAKKTVIRRIFKVLPQSPELQAAMTLETKGHGESLDLSAMLESPDPHAAALPLGDAAEPPPVPTAQT
jgi:recombination protein RecT